MSKQIPVATEAARGNIIQINVSIKQNIFNQKQMLASG